MTAKDYWDMFLLTGAPAFYLQYKAYATEGNDVSNDPGHRTSGHRLQ